MKAQVEVPTALDTDDSLSSAWAWFLVALTALSCLGYFLGHVDGSIGDYTRQKALMLKDLMPQLRMGG